MVAPREGRVSRNSDICTKCFYVIVAPREGRVSRNADRGSGILKRYRRAPRGACE